NVLHQGRRERVAILRHRRRAKLRKRIAHGDPFRRRERITAPLAPLQHRAPRRPRRDPHDLNAIVHDLFVRRIGAVPFDHRELRRMQGSALAASPSFAQEEELPLTRRQELLHCEFGARVQVTVAHLERIDVRFRPGRDRQHRWLGLGEPLRPEPFPHRPRNRRPRRQERPPVGVARLIPPRGGRHDAAPMPFRGLAAAANLAREAPNSGPFGYFRTAGSPAASEVFVVKVIASDVRKGNVLEHEDGQLYVVLSHETFRPGKGTPTTTIVMRRITDGVKTTAVHKTTDGLEKAFVEQVKHSYLYDDGDAGLVFMNPTTYDQVHLSRDMVGDSVAYLQPEMIVDLTMYEGQALSIEL